MPTLDPARPAAALEAGGDTARLLIAGRPPAALAEPDEVPFERIVRLAWPGQVGPVMADAGRLPFVEALFDRVLLTSQLPRARARADLRELWRIMAPAALALLAIKARRWWQPVGWTQADLAQALDDAMFVTHDWRVATLPKRWHLVLVGKADGLRPSAVQAATSAAPVAAASLGRAAHLGGNGQ